MPQHTPLEQALAALQSGGLPGVMDRLGSMPLATDGARPRPQRRQANYLNQLMRSPLQSPGGGGGGGVDSFLGALLGGASRNLQGNLLGAPEPEDVQDLAAGELGPGADERFRRGFPGPLTSRANREPKVGAKEAEPDAKRTSSEALDELMELALERRKARRREQENLNRETLLNMSSEERQELLQDRQRRRTRVRSR